MHRRPKISIVIPVYNRTDLVKECIQSILNQQFQNWELIIVDDGSEKDTIALLEEFQLHDDRIKLMRRNSLPKGAQTCRNIGLEAGTGTYVMFVDSDDLLAPFCLEQRLNEISQRSDLDFIVFPQLLFYEKPGDSNQLINVRSNVAAINRFFTLCYYLDVPWINGAVIFRKQSLLNSPINWDTKLKGYQDVAFHLECLVAGMKFKYADCKPDYYYRVHNGERIGDAIFSVDTLLATGEMLSEMFEKIKIKGLLTTELKIRIIRSFFHTLIRKFINQGRRDLACDTLNNMNEKNIVSGVLYFQIYLYIYFHSPRYKRFDPLCNRIFYRLWRKSIFERMSENYLKHSYQYLKNGVPKDFHNNAII